MIITERSDPINRNGMRVDTFRNIQFINSGFGHHRSLSFQKVRVRIRLTQTSGVYSSSLSSSPFLSYPLPSSAFFTYYLMIDDVKTPDYHLIITHRKGSSSPVTSNFDSSYRLSRRTERVLNRQAVSSSLTLSLPMNC